MATPIPARWWLSGICLLLAAATLIAATPAKKKSVPKSKSKTAAAKKKTTTRKAASKVPPKPRITPSSPIAKGYIALEDHNFAYAETAGLESQKLFPTLKDYSAWLVASARFGKENFAGAAEAAEAIWSVPLGSPLTGRASMLAARSWLKVARPGEAVRVLRRNALELPQPSGELLLAQALEQLKEPITAAASYQRVFYDYPLSSEAVEAGAALSRLQNELGSQYPPVLPKRVLTRSSALLKTQPRRVQDELGAWLDQFTSADRELARVRIAAADYYAKPSDSALRELQDLTVSSADADSERLFYVYTAARKLDRDSEAQSALTAFASKYPKSQWRVQALVLEGNRHLLDNEYDRYEPYYQACADAFPDDARGAYCHWKIVWSAYLRRKPESANLLKDHLHRFPSSEKANSSLYFLGRLAEYSGDFGQAKTLYTECNRRFPNSYYGVLARDQLNGTKMHNAVATPAAFLDSVAFPVRGVLQLAKAQASDETLMRINRGKALNEAGLEDLAEAEIRYGARKDPTQSLVLAVELANINATKGYPDRAIRSIKNLVPGYLFLPFGGQQDKLWRLAFPLPYSETLRRCAEQNNLDPYLVAGLIRQESEFNAKAISPARAYGLTQVMPATGRDLSRRLGIKRFTTTMLHDPETNLRMGTHYLQMMLSSLDNNLEATLAAYNAGKTRAVRWLSWADYREPAEFVETIPFTETREYVQSVIRNAHVYRSLYGNTPARTTIAKE